jgi:hypothetical protein
MIEAVLVISLLNLILQAVGVFQRRAALREQRRQIPAPTNNTSQTPPDQDQAIPLADWGEEKGRGEFSPHAFSPRCPLQPSKSLPMMLHFG